MNRTQGLVFVLNSIPALILALTFSASLQAFLLRLGIPASSGMSASVPMMIMATVLIPSIVIAFSDGV